MILHDGEPPNEFTRAWWGINPLLKPNAYGVLAGLTWSPLTGLALVLVSAKTTKTPAATFLAG